MRPPLLILGNVNVDLVMGEVDDWPAVGTEVILPRSEMRPGGSAGNTSLALTGMGVPHRLVAGVGNDVLGQWLAARFDPASSTWIVSDCATTVTVGIVHKGGDRAFFTSKAHLHEARLEDLVERIQDAPTARSFACVSGGFLMPSFVDGTTRLLRFLRARGWHVAIDPGWPPDGWAEDNRRRCREWLAEADYALLNAEEVRGLAGAEADASEAVASLLGAGGILVVKRGPDGADAIGGGRTISVEAPRVEVVDTVGAGDTFNAAFLAHLSEGGDLQGALERGVGAASLAVSTFPRRYA